jgi:hypothetical protein
MKKEDRNRADARFNKVRPGKTGNTEQDVASKAVLDSMARLKALRLAREATEPPRPAATLRKASAKKKSVEKTPALSEWLAGQQSGGRRT